MFLLLACADVSTLPDSVELGPLDATVSGVVALSVDAGEAASVTFEVDGVEIAGTVSGDWTAAWDTRAWDDGAYVVGVRASDGHGGERTDAAEVWVSNHGSAPGDVRFVNPGEGVTACGEIPVEAMAEGAVTFAVDGGDLAVSAGLPRRWTLDAGGLADGTHLLGASWFAADGGRVTVRRELQVEARPACDPPPVVTLSAPGYDAYSPGELTLAAEVADAGGVVRVDFVVDGEPLASDEAAPFATTWTDAPTGLHTVVAVATDTAGQTSRTEARVWVDGQAPRVTLAVPTDREWLSGVVDVVVTIEEELALERASLLVDGEVVAELAEGENTWSWDTALWGWGEHVVEAVALDRAGHLDTAVVEVEVDNPASVTLLEPSDGPAGSDLVAVEAVATDDRGVASLSVWADGELLAEGGAAAWDTCSVLPGVHTVHADAVDDANQASTDAVRVRVVRPPEVALVEPPGELAATTRVAAWVRSDRPLASVGWDVDGAPIGGVSNPRDGLPGPCALRCAERCRGWAAALDATGLSEGEHVVTVTVTDGAGESASASFTAWLTHDADGDGVPGDAFGGADCDDADPDAFPGAEEDCDGVDDDCDGTVDEDYDLDGDGSFDATRCGAGEDCDDADATVSPAAAETCDGIDNDCDGAVDASEPPAQLAFGDRTNRAADLGAVAVNLYEVERTVTLKSVSVFVDPGGAAELVFRVYTGQQVYTPYAASAAVPVSGGPGWYRSPELDVTLEAGVHYAIGVERETVVADWYSSVGGPPRAGITCGGGARGEPDGDGVLVDSASSSVVFAQRLHIVTAVDRDADADGETPFCGDCADDDASMNSTVAEVCNGIDDDCDGTVDAEFDADADGWGSCRDCDDADSALNPDAAEACGDALDQDCDGYAPRCEATTAEVPLADAQATLSGVAGSDGAGSAVAGGADLDGDGYVDLLVAAPGADDGGSRSGAVYLLRGPISTDGSLDDADVTWWGESAADAAGTSLSAAVLGGATFSGVDLTGDGVEDAVAGAPGDDDGGSNAGAVYVIGIEGGGLGGAAATRFGPDAYAGLGGSVAVGDLDGDGVADLAAGGTDVVWVELGPVADAAPFADLQILAEDAGDGLGAALAVGDVDGDGIDDLAIGAPDWGGTGAVYLREGPVEAGGVLADSVLALGRWEGEASGDEAGTAVAFAGDTDGDGYGDLLVGAPGADREAGRVYLVAGPPGVDPLPGALAVLRGDTAGAALGAGVAGAGDVDGDGRCDLLSGAPGDSRGGAGAGAAWLLYGPARGNSLLGGAGTVLLGAASDGAGGALAGVGDVDGDGYGDLLVGVAGADGAAWDAGAAYLFLEIP
ncbi:MAG: MopE-related protein [Pseudomonadota bacterium]|nr:MopE-related protein [Pseudomonadota bacterium]